MTLQLKNLIPPWLNNVFLLAVHLFQVSQIVATLCNIGVVNVTIYKAN